MFLPRVIDDAGWLLRQVAALTDRQERGAVTPWQVTDAPESFIASQLKGIVGIEIEITQIEGKWKVSQNRSEADRQGVASGLAQDTANGGMAELVRRYGGLKTD